jgi:hypothetical protein
MEKQVTLSISELKNIFKAGMELENQWMEMELEEIEEIDALDFGEYMKEIHDIEI